MKIWIEFAVIVIMALLLWTSCKSMEKVYLLDCGCHGHDKYECLCNDVGSCICDVTVKK